MRHSLFFTRLFFFFFFVAFLSQASAQSYQLPANHKIEYFQPVNLEKLSYNGTKKSLKAIQLAALPAARQDNIIAIHICRQTMFALGDAFGLQSLKKSTAKSTPSAILTSWSTFIENKASSGDMFYKTVLGVMYLEGDGELKNTKQALYLWSEAAKGGYHDAFLKLGIVYSTGQLVPQDIDTALKFYLKAGEKGSAIALYNIGAIYFHGDKVPQDRKIGAIYYKKSAELGYAPGQCDTGLCYLKGHGFSRDYKEAIRWLQKAAQQGDQRAQYQLSRLGVPMDTKPVTELPSATGTKQSQTQNAPKNFSDVEICCLEGPYLYIRNCDIDSLDKSVNSNLANLPAEKNGWTPLTLAIGSGCENMVKYLVDHGADPNERHPDFNFTPLHIAVLTNQKNIVEYLIDKGADFNAISTPPSRLYWFSSMKGTPGHTAVGNGKKTILELLLTKGIDYNIKNADGKTIYEYAVDLGARQKIENIYNKVGIPVPDLAPSVEELMSAIHSCSVDPKTFKSQWLTGFGKVKKLLKSNPELARERDKFGNTPLHTAAFYYVKEVVSLLVVDYGADVNAKTNSGETPLLKIVNTLEVAKILVSNGARVNETDNDGHTVLHHIADRSDGEQQLKLAQYFLDAGARKNIRDNSGRLAYDYAADNDHTKLAKILEIR